MTAPQQTNSSGRSAPSTTRSVPPLPTLITAAVGVSASLTAAYYAYTRYKKHRFEQHLQNLSWSIKRSTADQQVQIADQMYHAFDDMLRANNSAGTSPLTRAWWAEAIKYFVNNPKQRGLLAVDDRSGAIIGSVYGNETDDDIVTLGPFTVLTEYSNHGIARALIQQLIDECLQSNQHRTLVLLQDPSNSKAFALYTKLGFRVSYNVVHMRGFVTQTERVPAHDVDIEVKRFDHSDIDDAAELLKTTLSGISRRNYISSMLDTKINTEGIGYIARSKSNQHVVGFTTAANSEAGIWCYARVAAFEALYTHASSELQALKPADKHTPVVHIPQARYTELQWLLSVGCKVESQLNVMSKNDFNVRNGYGYCPSGGG